MPLPVDYGTGTVTGTFTDTNGDPVVGTISFTPSASRLLGTGAVILGDPVVVPLDDAGSLTVTLPASDDPNVSPTDFTYRVDETFVGTVGSTYFIDVLEGVTLDLADVLVPGTVNNGTVIWAATLPSQTGNAGKLLRTDGTDLSWAGLGSVIADASAKVTPVGADEFVMSDSAAAGVAKRISFTDLSAAIGDADPLFFDLTGLGPTYALDLSAVPDAVKSVTVSCDGPIALTITPPVRPDRLGLVVAAGGGGAITAAVVGGAFPIAGTTVLFAYLEPLPPALGTGMQLGPRHDPVVASVNGQAGTVVLDADDIGDGTTNKAYTGTEQSKLAGIAAGATANQSDATTNAAIAAKASKVSITGATKTKVTYNADGIVTGGADATTADIADSSDKRYVTDAQQTVIGNTSGTNTGDQTLPTLASLNAVPTSRTLAGLDLSADRTASALRTALGLVIGTDVLAPNGSGASLTGIPESAVTNLVTDLAAKAPLASPALTGNPTAPTQSAGDNSTKVATTAYVDTATASHNLPFTTGDYYSLSGGETPHTACALSPAGVLVAHPVYLQAGNYDRIAMYVATAAVSTYRLGVYPNNAATYLPDGQSLILDAGTLNMNAGTGIQQITVTLAIPTSGIYWLAVLCDAYTAKPSIVGWAGNSGVVPNVPYFGSIVYGSVPGRSPFACYATGVTTGAMPATFPTSTKGDTLPQITVRKA